MKMLPQPNITDLVYNGKCWVMNDLTNKPVMLQRDNPSGGAWVKQANPISIPASEYGWYQFWMYHLYTNDDTPLRFDFYNQNNQLIYSWREQKQSANGSVIPIDLISSDAGNQLVTGSDNNLFVPPGSVGSGNVLILITTSVPSSGYAAGFDYVVVAASNYSPDLVFRGDYTIYYRGAGIWMPIDPATVLVPISTLLYHDYNIIGPAWYRAIYPNSAQSYAGDTHLADLWWQRISYANASSDYANEANNPIIVFAEPTRHVYLRVTSPGQVQQLIFASNMTSQVLIKNIAASNSPVNIAGVPTALPPSNSVLVTGNLDLGVTNFSIMSI